ncbi:MAG: ribonuclease HII [Arenimonas sp.]
MTRARVAGVDEAGRGPLAGPVVCAAVILDARRPIAGLDDSKVLSEQQRERLFPIIQRRCIAWNIVFVDREEIDTLNILWATMAGMRRALCAIVPSATSALIDGDRVPPDLPCPARALIKGDALEPAIMAASILAKVSRDRYMTALHERFPGYRFDRNKGYPTREHFASLARIGPCVEHRRSFAPVRDCAAVPAFSAAPEASFDLPRVTA